MTASIQLVCGVGLNDAEYVIHRHTKDCSGRRRVLMCPFYRVWQNMLVRCYSDKYQATHLSYVGCTVSDEWHVFSVFKAWMETQDWRGKQLDKDVLVLGNQKYSPETCAFVSAQVNRFMVGMRDGGATVGSHWYRRKRKYATKCGNPFAGKTEHLGYFATPEEAHEAWRKRKHELACQYADTQTDSRVAEALRTRFAPKED